MFSEPIMACSHTFRQVGKFLKNSSVDQDTQPPPEMARCLRRVAPPRLLTLIRFGCDSYAEAAYASQMDLAETQIDDLTASLADARAQLKAYEEVMTRAGG